MRNSFRERISRRRPSAWLMSLVFAGAVGIGQTAFACGGGGGGGAGGGGGGGGATGGGGGTTGGTTASSALVAAGATGTSVNSSVTARMVPFQQGPTIAQQMQRIQAQQQQRTVARRTRLESQAAFVRQTRSQLASQAREGGEAAASAVQGSVRPGLLQQRRSQYENEMARRRDLYARNGSSPGRNG